MKLEVKIRMDGVVGCVDTMTIDVPDEEIADMAFDELWNTVHDAAIERGKVSFSWDEAAVEAVKRQQDGTE